MRLLCVCSPFLCLVCFLSSLVSEEKGTASLQEEPQQAKEIALLEKQTYTQRAHIVYLARSHEVGRALQAYDEYVQMQGSPDYDLLQHVALAIMEGGAHSPEPGKQLASLFGSSLAGISASVDVLEEGICSTYPEVQLAAIQFLGHLQDDRCEELFTKAMSSEYFFTRLEAAYQLASRKAKTATGQIESLMHRVPPQMHCFFAPFFALIGSSDAMILLKQMMDDPYHVNRTEAIINAAKFGRDDLLPAIRSRATHLNSAEQEACAFALGTLKDSKSLPLLQKLSQSPSANVQLASLFALYRLGETSAKKRIEERAKGGDVFAITLLREIPDSETTLRPLAKETDLQIRFNALCSLLGRKDPAAAPLLAEFLIKDSRDLGFQPLASVGNSLMAWKVTPSAAQHKEDNYTDLQALSLSVRERLLEEALELPPASFLELAKQLFAQKQTDLIPVLVRLIENMQSEQATQLLAEQTQKAGAPLTRAYCNLALFRLTKQEPYRSAVLQWIALKQHTEILRFRPSLKRDARFREHSSSFELTPEENSRLLIECYQTLALSHENEGVKILLEGIKSGPEVNQAILSGLLVQAIQ